MIFYTLSLCLKLRQVLHSVQNNASVSHIAEEACWVGSAITNPWLDLFTYLTGNLPYLLADVSCHGHETFHVATTERRGITAL
jgi:hypothetical protein